MIKSIKVVVPTLNTHNILPKLINSLKNQTWPHWQLIFVDGDSNKDHSEWLNNCCKSDSRLKVIKQERNFKGIYGAMNQGFETIQDNEWVLFWGSDDWAISPDTFETLVNKVNSYSNQFDIVVCKGKYIDKKSKRLSRVSKFFDNKFPMILDRKNFRNKLLLGMTPPHQATLFSRRSFLKLSAFVDNLTLSADLYYFLKFSEIDNISILVIDYDLVCMSTCGISSQKNILRISEVLFSYKSSFGKFFLLPFILRYLRKIHLKFLSKL